MDCSDLSSLRDEVTCPVCLEIPRRGALFQCTNGHIICEEDFHILGSGTDNPECPECKVPYPKEPLRCRLAERLLNVVKLPCRYADKGCRTELARPHLEKHENEECTFGQQPCRYSHFGCLTKCSDAYLAKHEESCEFRGHPCRYLENGCQVALPSGLLEKHEDVCELQPYPCVIMSCEQKVCHSSMLSHLRSFHALDFRESSSDEFHSRAFPIDKSMQVTWSDQWSQWKGTVIEHDGHHFYLGLVRMGCMWTASVHLLGRPSEVNSYRVELIAQNPKQESRHLTFGGPINSLLISGETKFQEEIVGLTFPSRIAEALINKHSCKKENVLRILCKITKTKCF